MMRVFILAAGIAVLNSVAAGQAPSAQAVPPGNAEAGKKLYVSYGCYQCHGHEAQGSSATGPRLGPKPIAFTAFSRYVRNPTGQMPPYTTKVVSDAAMADIYAFVQARQAPAQGVPLLREP
jgi:mono/diheme cytochrome c family protein